jgi:hypothetical protein
MGKGIRGTAFSGHLILLNGRAHPALLQKRIAETSVFVGRGETACLEQRHSLRQPWPVRSRCRDRGPPFFRNRYAYPPQWLL